MRPSNAFINRMLHPEVQEFIDGSDSLDIDKILLSRKHVGEVPIGEVVDQVKSRRKAKSKIPVWYNTNGIVFPPPLSLEQCSSQITAAFKGELIKGKALVDLTGGAGVDTYYLSKSFESVAYVERNKLLAEVTSHNFAVLGAKNIKVTSDDAENYLNQLNEVDCIYLDPARRDSNKNKIFQLSDCEPNVPLLLSRLLTKATSIWVKASPLLDIRGTVKELEHVNKVYVIAVDNECKEVLYCLEKNKCEGPQVVTVNFAKPNLRQELTFSLQSELKLAIDYSQPKAYLYEPNVAILKAGAFKSVAKAYPVTKLHANSHLYTSETLLEGFPGRKFTILHQCRYNKKDVSKYLTETKANITVRNFPVSVAQIRKKLGLKEGGNRYLFATTDMNGNKIILITTKVGLGF